MIRKKLTILTPTYNRVDCLKQLFESLIAQTSNDFQWILIDDGSSDRTKEWFAELPKTVFEKRYLYKQNGGKHKALNYSHPYIRGDYVMTLDSDDELLPDAVEAILKYWEKYQQDASISGITFLKGKKDRSFYKSFAQQELVSSVVEAYNKGLKGEFLETVRAENFLQNPFPEFEGEKYFPESWLWVTIGESSRTVYINKVVYLFEYLNEGLTKGGRTLRLNSPKSCACAMNSMSGREFKFSLRAKKTIAYIGYLLYAKTGVADILKLAKNKGLTAALFPAGVMLMLWWKIKYK